MAGDIYYDKVTLLLPMTGTNGSTTFTDQSPSVKTVTANGNAQISTAVSAGGDGFFDGTGDYLTSTITSAIGIADFTVEANVYVASFAVDREIVSIGNIANGSQFDFAFELSTAGELRGLIFNGSGSTLLDISTTGYPVSLNTWTHVAMTVLGTAANLWIDGIERKSGTIVGTRVQNRTDLRIGRLTTASPRDFIGHMSDVRITKNSARYTSNFTPPVSPLPAYLEPRPLELFAVNQPIVQAFNPTIFNG
jgi:hypothetical protein